MKQREEEERKRRAQGQWVHEEQMKKIAQKKAKEMEERNRKHKEVRQEGTVSYMIFIRGVIDHR